MGSVFTEGEFKIFADRKRKDGRFLKYHSHGTSQMEKISRGGEDIQFIHVQVP
jgi:hypothetical protein